ncbi:MarR family protein [Rhizobiales bacterium GAS191]|jgi:DNA-binding MarR family transcriptional regulator|nr:MarR family protein [Rhizobiales bacterium GAS113]SEE47577.1 MarR family protein [Rhizobiales bacterium GAS191]
MTDSRRSKADLARRAWQLMFDFLIFTVPARQQSLQRRGLTPNDSRALFSLDEDQGRPIGTLASEWGCDPSNATFIIDRLEKAGLAERRAAAGDRRVKLVALTSRGAQAKKELLDEFHVPPPQLSNLRVADLEALERILQSLRSENTHE